MGQSLRSLAVKAGVTVHECARPLRRAGFEVSVGKQRLDGPELAAARAALGLTHHLSTEPIEGIGRTFDGAAGGLRLLRPLREKGKVGREHTTAIEHVYAHGIPGHLKAVAKDMVDELLAEGCLAEKVGRSRRHVWLTATGQARLLRAKASA